MLAGILHRDGTVLSATETLTAELSNADHLGVLGPIWYDLTRREQATRFAAALRDALPGPLAESALDDPACTWLWRSLRQAEATGLDGPVVLREAIAARSLADARDIARVLDSRVRRMIAHRPPSPPGKLGRPADRRRRTRRSRGTSQNWPKPWTTAPAASASTPLAPDRTGRSVRSALFPPTMRNAPSGSAARPSSAATANCTAATLQTDPIGPAPGMTSPEAWADWHAASAAQDRSDGIDLRPLTDGQLMLRRARYERELSWAPPYVAEELRLARLQARTAWENAVRADHAAQTSASTESAARNEDLGRIWHATQVRAENLAQTLATAQETRSQWAALTGPDSPDGSRSRHRTPPPPPGGEAATASRNRARGPAGRPRRRPKRGWSAP